MKQAITIVNTLLNIYVLPSILLNLTKILPSFAYFMTCCRRLTEPLATCMYILTVSLASPIGCKCADLIPGLSGILQFISNLIKAAI